MDSSLVTLKIVFIPQKPIRLIMLGTKDLIVWVRRSPAIAELAVVGEADITQDTNKYKIATAVSTLRE